MNAETKQAYDYHFKEILPFEQVKQLIEAKDYSKFGQQDLLKMRVGWEFANKVESNETTGEGSGSTSEAAIRAIGMRLINQEITGVKGVATSRKLGDLAASLGIEQIPLAEAGLVKRTFDGADEVEVVINKAKKITGFRITKGGGGAHTIERELALISEEWTVLVDSGKVVEELGEFPLPVEVEEGKAEVVEQFLTEKYEPMSIDRKPNKDGTIFHTDKGNIILRVKMGKGRIKSEWEQEWREIDGVVDTGLFVKERQPTQVLIANDDGTIETLEKEE